MDAGDQAGTYGVGYNVSGKVFHIILSPNRSIVVALLPQSLSPAQGLINGNTASRFDTTHKIGQRFLAQLHQTMHMIRHHNPRRKIRPTLLLCCTKFPNNQPPQPPITKKRLSLINDSRKQINPPNP